MQHLSAAGAGDGGVGVGGGSEEEELLWERVPCSWSLLMAMAAATAVVLLLSFAEEDVKAIQAKVVGLPKRLVIDDRALKPWLTGVDHLPKLSYVGCLPFRLGSTGTVKF